MKFNRKKIIIFIIILFCISLLFFILFNFVLPIKTSMLSGDVGDYKSGDLLLYTESETYNVDDVILYIPSSISSTLVVEIIESNPDGTFKVIGTNPEPIENLDQDNLKQEQIIGKVIFSISPLIAYPIGIIIIIVLAYILTNLIYKKVKNKRNRIIIII